MAGLRWTRDGVVVLVVLAALGGALAEQAANCSSGHKWDGDVRLCVCDYGNTQSCGVGVCLNTVPACDSDNKTIPCYPKPPTTPNADWCNGLDDNCNGLIDEDYVNETVTCGRGVCKNTVKTCINGTYVGSAWCFEDRSKATPEVCNGIDDDCDGLIDEGLGEWSCGKSACTAYLPKCINGTLTKESDCQIKGAYKEETCNGIDDDCDGEIDEGFYSRVCANGCVVAGCFYGTLPSCSNAFCSTVPSCINRDCNIGALDLDAKCSCDFECFDQQENSANAFPCCQDFPTTCGPDLCQMCADDVFCGDPTNIVQCCAVDLPCCFNNARCLPAGRRSLIEKKELPMTPVVDLDNIDFRGWDFSQPIQKTPENKHIVDAIRRRLVEVRKKAAEPQPEDIEL